MKPVHWLWIIFLVALFLRLTIAFGNPFLDYEAYDVLRNVKSIHESGLPLFDDPLSYQGRTRFFSPVYYYFIAFFGFVMPLEFAAKLLPNLLFTSLVFLSYLIVRRLTSSEGSSLFAAAATGFLPIGFLAITNTASDFSLALPLVFLSYYFLINLHKRNFSLYALLTGIVLVLTHSFAFVFVVGLLGYLLLSRLESTDTKRKTNEISLFLLLFGMWLYLLVYKPAFREFGFSVVWQSIPVDLLSQWYSQFSFIEAIYVIGFVPLLLGVFAAYHALSEKGAPKLFIFISNILLLIPLLAFRIIELQAGLLFLGLNIAILSGYGAHIANSYFRQLKLSKLRFFLVWLVVLLFAFSALGGISLFRYNTPSFADESALLFARDLPPGTVVSQPVEGSFVSYVSSQKNLMDTGFVLAPNTEFRYQSVLTVYTNPFSIPVVRAMDDFNSEYIFVSSATKENPLTSALLLEGSDCFSILYDETASILKKDCTLS